MAKSFFAVLNVTVMTAGVFPKKKNNLQVTSVSVKCAWIKWNRTCIVYSENFQGAYVPVSVAWSMM